MKQERLAYEAQKLPRYVGRTLYSLETADLSAEMENEQQRRASLNYLKAENVYENVLPGISVMPVSVSHYYNSCLSNTDDFHCGNGWKTSAHQQVSTLKLNDLDYYVWLDGDGTKHYFLKNGSQPYEDSEGMELKLRYNSTEKKYTIEDKNHNKMEFQGDTSDLANLKCIIDAHGNKAEFIYVDDKLVTIKDPAGRETQFIYDSITGKLDKITIPDVPVADEEEKRWEVSFVYDDNKEMSSKKGTHLFFVN